MATVVLGMTPADVLRLGRKADRQRLTLLHTPQGDHFFQSQTDPSVIYHTTPESCDCPGFTHLQRCKHVAALVRRLD